MSTQGKFWREFLQREDGPTAVEYALLLTLVVVVCVGAVTTLGRNANTTFASSSQGINAASP